jgi:hypothetical protein
MRTIYSISRIRYSELAIAHLAPVGLGFHFRGTQQRFANVHVQQPGEDAMTLTKHFNSKSRLTTHFNSRSGMKRREQVETDTFGETALSRHFAPISATAKQASEQEFDMEVREATAPVRAVRRGMNI